MGQVGGLIHRQLDFNLQAANGSSISTYGRKSLTLDLGLRRSLPWVFVIADVDKPLLSADFLHHFQLTVDLNNKKLVDNTTQLTISGVVANSAALKPAIPPPNSSAEYAALLVDYPQLTQPHNFSEQPVRHNVAHSKSRQVHP